MSIKEEAKKRNTTASNGTNSNGTRTRRRQSANQAGRQASNLVADTAKQHAQALAQLQAKATAAEFTRLQQSGEYFDLIANELQDAYSGFAEVLEADALAIDSDLEEVFLLPSSSSYEEIIDDDTKSN